MTQTLMARTRELVNESPLTLPDLYAQLIQAGITDISFYWLRKFKAGYVRDPSVNKVQRLYEFLSGKELVVH